MVETIKFENFRGFEEIEIATLRPITLISGRNNAGKSSIPEGLFLFFDHIAPESFSKINYFRGIVLPNNSISQWESAFYQMETGKTMKISITKNGVPTYLEYTRDDSFIPPNDITRTAMNALSAQWKAWKKQT